MFNKMFFRKYLTFRNIKDVKTDIEHYIINQDLKRIKQKHLYTNYYCKIYGTKIK